MTMSSSITGNCRFRLLGDTLLSMGNLITGPQIVHYKLQKSNPCLDLQLVKSGRLECNVYFYQYPIFLSTIFLKNQFKAERAKVEDFILNPKQNDRRKCSNLDGCEGCSSRYYQGRWEPNRGKNMKKKYLCE